jgi:hypothetical protein
MKNQIIEIKAITNRRDFMSIDKTVVLSAEGAFFHVGDTVYHEGAPEDESATINSFFINEESMDIIARTTKGEGRISFLYTK